MGNFRWVFMKILCVDCVTIWSVVLVQYRLMTYRRTVTETAEHRDTGHRRSSIASRGKTDCILENKSGGKVARLSIGADRCYQLLIIRSHGSTYVHAAYCYRPSSVVCWSVCLSHACKNGWTDLDAVWVEDSGGTREPCSLHYFWQKLLAFIAQSCFKMLQTHNRWQPVFPDSLVDQRKERWRGTGKMQKWATFCSLTLDGWLFWRL